jgi:hypothetical protein
VSTVYISATAAADIGAVETELAALLPSATVTSSRDLADAVSGSLVAATKLAHELGTWLTVGVLLATVAAASLFTLASVTPADPGTGNPQGARLDRPAHHHPDHGRIRCGGAVGQRPYRYA